MKPLVHALQAIFGTMLILGCASPGDMKPEIKPVFAMQHGGAQAEGYFQLARHYQSNGRTKDAEAAYRKALALDDRLAEAHSALGAIYALNRSFAQAMAELNAAVSLDPSAPHFRNNLGYAYYLQGKSAEAVANFEAAAALDPANARTWNNLGLALTQLGRGEQAERAFARATALASAASAPATVPSQVPAPMLAGAEAKGAVAAAALTETREQTRIVKGDVFAPIGGDDAAAFAPLASMPTQSTRSTVEVFTQVPESLVALEQLRPVAVSHVPILRLLDPVELRASAELVTALANPVTASAMESLLEPISAPSAPLKAVTAFEAAIEPLQSVGWQMLASVESVPMPSLRVDDAPSLFPLVTPIERSDERAGGRPSEAASGTRVFEVPVTAQVVAVAPHALELQWSGSAVIARPASANANDVPMTSRCGLEVSNGNGVTGMARKVDGLLQAVGLPRSRLTNQKPFTQRSTEIQYRDGHEVAAASLSARLPNRPAIVRDDRLRADIDVRLVLGKDLPVNVALVTPAGERDRWAGAVPTIGARVK